MVLTEANHLRGHATDEEKSKLNFDSLEPDLASKCIYGQMTGCCESERANDLYLKRFDDRCTRGKTGLYSFSSLFKNDNFLDREILTPIEVYITLKGSKNKKLIQYIKGEINVFKP